MVDVTKESFEEQLPRFREAASDPSLCFMAFDFEFTGIAQPGTSFTEFNSYDDSPAERYAKLREVVLRYSICQLGVAMFHRRSTHSKEAEGLTCSVFNFNLFTNEDTVISASSMQFLARNGFDLNSWVLKGIPWVNAAEKKHIMDGVERKIAELDREQAQEDEKSLPGAAADEAAAGGAADGAAGEPRAAENGMVLEKEADRATAADALGKLDDWLAALDGEEDASDEDSAPPELLLPPLEWAGLRRFVYHEIEANPKYAHHGLLTEKRGRSTIAVLRPSRGQRRKRREAEKAKLSAEANRKIGARFIFEAMSRACRGDEEEVGREPIPLVGHNCFADLAFLFSSFAAIPESYEAWKAAVHDAFPVILDTKHVAAFGASANWWQWSNTALESLHTELVPSTESKGGSASSSSSSSSARSLHYLPPDPIEITFANDFDRYRAGSEGVERFHEAGWDAYCTGCVLTRLAEKTLSWSALTTGTATRKKRSREEDGEEDQDAAVVDEDCDAPSGENLEGDRKRRKAHGGKVSVGSIKKPSDDSLVSISAVSAMSQLISPRKVPRKREKSSAPEEVAPVGQYGILCELPFNELNLMRSPHVIKLGEVIDIKRDGSATATSSVPRPSKAPRSGEMKVAGGAGSGEQKPTGKKSGIGSRLKKALGLSGKSSKSGPAGSIGADTDIQDESAQAPATATAVATAATAQDDQKDEESDEKEKEPQCTIVSY